MHVRAVAFPVLLALTAGPGSSADEAKGKKPTLALRGTPRFSFSPVSVLFTAELTGGDDVEDFYCPELTWEWDDGGKSVQEGDCAPFETGKTKIERRFTANHVYGRASIYTVKVTLRRTGKAFATQNVQITVRPGAGDRSDVQDP
jgi:hypothetical protein